MSVIDIHRTHSLDAEHAREAAENLAKDLSEQFDVNYEWHGDELKFHRSGVKGKLGVRPSEVHVHVELGMLFRPLRGRFEKEIHTQLDKLLGKA